MSIFEIEKFKDLEKKPTGLVALPHYLGSKRYEISNHLGNVLAVVTDRKIPTTVGIDFYWSAEVVSVNEYYVFGGKVPNRCWEAAPEPGAVAENYRYGFNGKEEGVTPI